jgi:hypothetical protein
MCIQLQEADLSLIEDKVQEIIELARDVVRDGGNITAAFSISIRCREIQRLIDNQGVLQEVKPS